VTFRFSVLDEDERQALSYLHELGHCDPLTRVYNRRYLTQYLAAELAFAQRHHTDLSVILFDIDHFKRVNDESGHLVGDRVLARVAQVARAQCRTEDVVARYGGEEFVIVLRQTPVEGALALAERIRRVVAETSMVAGSEPPVRVSLSAGCASLDCVSGESTDALIRMADRRLYRAKEGGRNRVVAAEPRLRSVPPPQSARAGGDAPALEEEVPASRVQRVERTARAFEQLDEELKLVVGLRYQEDCSVAEIAAVLNASEDWVTERLLQAMQVLAAA
jgi:diguanylate cyclase (GGDEF)-like protein